MRLSIRGRAHGVAPEGRRSRLVACGAILVAACLALGSPGPAAAVRTPAAMRAAIEADPHFAAWAAALDTPLPRDPSGCASSDSLDAALVERSRRRLLLLESLAARGIEPMPPPPGVHPWPWGTSAVGAGSAAVVDSNDTAILVDRGTITFVNRVGELEVDPVFAARAFYAAHHDEYDFLVLCTNFRTQLANGAFLAYHQAIANDVTGLGYVFVRTDEHFDHNTLYTGKPAAGRLQSFVHLNDVNDFPADPGAPYFQRYSTTTLLGHELAHRWLARIWLDLPGLGPEPVLLGRQLSHWSFFFNSGGSPLEGNAWGADGRIFSTLDPRLGYGPLDLYLMGLLAPDEVPADSLWYVDAPRDFQPPTDAGGTPWNWESMPTPGVTCSGSRRNFTIRDVVLTNGIRLPAYPSAPHEFRAAFVLVTPGMEAVTALQLAKLAALRSAFEGWFTAHTRGRGQVDFTLHRVPARIVFVHRPHGDVEDSTLPIPITTRIELEQWSLPTSLADIQAALLWSVDGGATTTVAMTTTAPGEFTATLPPQPQGSTVRYAFRARSSFPGHEQRWPVDPPDSSFTFQVVPDTRGPSVQHVARTAWSPYAEPVLLRAVVRDEHAVDAVWVEYRIAGGDAPVATLPLLPVGVTDLYETRWSPPGRIDDRVEYRIVARDAAHTPHTSFSPATGFNTLVVTRALYEGAEFDDVMWRHRSLSFGHPDQWHHDGVNPLAGLYSWKVGPANNTAPGVIAPQQDAVLESPAVAVFPGGTLSFRHRYAFLLDEFDPRRYGVDGGLLEWQDVQRDGPQDRWFLLEPDSGYTHWLAIGVQSPLPNYPCFSGYEPFPQPVTCTFPAWVVNRTVRIRFRLVTAPVQPGRPGRDGWVLDDIALDPGPAPTAVALAGLAASRTAVGVRLTWQASDVAPGDAFQIGRAAGDVPEFTWMETQHAEVGRAHYEWEDHAPPGSATARYRVALWRAGREASAQVAVIEFGWRFALHPNVPNPFNPRTRLGFELGAPGPVRLALYDVRGRWVRTLVEAPLEAGPHAVLWDGTDAHGASVASGVYLARLTSGGDSAVRRLLLVR